MVSPGYDLCPSLSSVVPGFTLARTNASIEAAELSGMAARRMRPDRVSRYFRPFPPWLRLVGPAVDHLDGAGDEDLPGFGRIENAVVGAERNFGLVDLDHALQRLALGIDHRSSQLLRQQPGSLVCDAELGLELECRHAVRVGCHQMRGPEPHGQRQFGPVHHRASCDRRLTTAAEAFVGVRPALQRCRASDATGGANKTLRPASLKQKRRATRLVWKTRLEFAQRSCPCHWAPPRARRRWPAATPLYIIWGSLGQRDKPQPLRSLLIPWRWP